MEFAYTTGAGAAMTLFLVMGVKFLGSSVWRARMFGVVFVLLALYLSLGLFNYEAVHPLLSFVLARLSSLTPAAIWLLAFQLFRDGEKIPWSFWLCVSVYLLLRSGGVALLNLQVLSNSPLFYFTTITLPQLLMIGIALHAIALAIIGYEADLVEDRRRFRVSFVLAMSIFTLLTRIKTWIVYNSVVEGISAETLSPDLLDLLIMVYALAFSVGFFLHAFQANSAFNGLLERISSSVPVADFRKKRLSESDQQLVNRIRKRMEERKQFNEPGLTVVKFAKNLGVHPHKLRRVITTYFHFNNFNQFLNSFRIKEAAQQLRAGTDPISMIAYDVGFSSLSSFNTAFKALYGVTPSAYRLQDGAGAKAEESRTLTP
ncbi:MAG: helix-turn-helix transcriptional regulator [Pseudomonadales bacterium]|nr:helix-turn-helix transcriptional regulator [Pseudomonadales bacterium]MCP5356738.1 helix-turn-helix transcriptional regulator [Pseudomonadales bacterium]